MSLGKRLISDVSAAAAAPFVAMNSDGDIEDINGNITNLTTTNPGSGPGINIEYSPSTGKYYYVGWNISPKAISSSTPFDASSWGNDSDVTSNARTNFCWYDTESGWMWVGRTEDAGISGAGDPGRLSPTGVFTVSWNQYQRNNNFSYDGTYYATGARQSGASNHFYASDPSSATWSSGNTSAAITYVMSDGNNNVLLGQKDSNIIHYSSSGFAASSFSTYTPPWTTTQLPMFYEGGIWYANDPGDNKLYYSTQTLPTSSGHWSEITYPSGETYGGTYTNRSVMRVRYNIAESKWYLPSGNASNNYWTSTNGTSWTAQDTGSGKYIVIANFN